VLLVLLWSVTAPCCKLASLCLRCGLLIRGCHLNDHTLHPTHIRWVPEVEQDCGQPAPCCSCDARSERCRQAGQTIGQLDNASSLTDDMDNQL
jgi:hypothetical protein